MFEVVVVSAFDRGACRDLLTSSLKKLAPGERSQGGILPLSEHLISTNQLSLHNVDGQINSFRLNYH
jgi:hypothetical protein